MHHKPVRRIFCNLPIYSFFSGHIVGNIEFSYFSALVCPLLSALFVLAYVDSRFCASLGGLSSSNLCWASHIFFIVRGVRGTSSYCSGTNGAVLLKAGNPFSLPSNSLKSWLNLLSSSSLYLDVNVQVVGNGFVFSCILLLGWFRAAPSALMSNSWGSQRASRARIDGTHAQIVAIHISIMLQIAGNEWSQVESGVSPKSIRYLSRRLASRGHIVKSGCDEKGMNLLGWVDQLRSDWKQTTKWNWKRILSIHTEILWTVYILKTYHASYTCSAKKSVAISKWWRMN